MTLTAGTRLGSYEIVGLVGAGGMGEVYRAHDTTLNRDVALKVLPASVAADPDRLARFRREAQVLAALNHPNIAHIFGFELSGSTPALVMEFVEGPTLADRISAGPMPLADVLAIARQIADALEAAHDQNIVHRDLKPANVKVRDDGTVKVLDFGLAKAMDAGLKSGSAGAEANSPTLTARATQMGMIIGTAAYMAPEQAKGKSVDRRADIWAFGVVLYEMLTGERAFKGDDISETLASVLKDTPSFASLPDAVPPRLRRLLGRCLDRDVKTRLRDIGEARIEIAKIESGAPDESAPAQIATAALAPVKRSALPWIVAAAALLVAVGAMSWTLLHAPSLPLRGVTRSTFDVKDVSGFVAVSRDGTRLAYTVVGGPKNVLLAFRMVDQFDARAIPGSEGGAWPLFSPDGQWIAYSTLETPSKIKKIAVTGGTSITLCDGSLANGAFWADDDTILFGGAKGLMRVAATGGSPQQFTTIDAAKGETAHVHPQVLPGGTQVLFSVVSTDAFDAAHFAVVDPSKGGYHTVAPGGAHGRYVASGHLTYVRGSTLFAVPFDVRRLTITGGEVPVVEDVSTFGPPGTGDYTVSDAGLLIYVEGDNNKGTTLAWADRKGATTILPGQKDLRWGTGRLSPDGTRVANGIHDDQKGGTDIWVLDAQRGTLQRLTFGGTNDNPVWTPDGTRVVYGSAQDGKVGLYSVAADGSGKPELVLATTAAPVPSSFTPDGRTIVYSQSDKRSQIFVLPVPVGGTPTPHPLHDAAGSETDGQLSPDGKWIAYQSVESGSSEIYVQPFPGPGAKVRISTQGGIGPRWGRTGRELFYWGATVGSRGLIAVDMQTDPSLRPGAPHELFQSASGSTWDVAPDGLRFLIELSRSGTTVTTIATVTDWFEELRRRAPAKK
jgi:serine/threonine-protein kinase